MQPENKDTSLEALNEIRSIMDRSARFISLSGWSGIWAGSTALVGAFLAYRMLHSLDPDIKDSYLLGALDPLDSRLIYFLYLAVIVFIVSLAGGLFFTVRKAKRNGIIVWNHASRQLLLHLFFPIIAGGFFCVYFFMDGFYVFVSPACLVFYGLALISASKFTLSDIRYLGMIEVALGCANLFFPWYSFYFWAAGFGVLHILYGIFMWNKYDKKPGK